MIKHRFDSVVFDVDSTLVTIEGLDYLAKIKNKERHVKLITEMAMNGKFPMKEAMEIKMDILSPNAKDLEIMGKAYLKNLVKGARETVSILKENNISIWILTGNFQPSIDFLAKELEIKEEHIIANRIFFDKKGNYLGFDAENPLSQNGGKAKLIRKNRRRLKRVAFIGDGSTDVEAKNEVDLFIGFGGVVARPKVEALSEIYVKESNLKAVLPFILG